MYNYFVRILLKLAVHIRIFTEGHPQRSEETFSMKKEGNCDVVTQYFLTFLKVLLQLKKSLQFFLQILQVCLLTPD